MNETYDNAKRAARVVTQLVDRTQAGELLWSRTPPSTEDEPTDPSVQLKEQHQTSADGSTYVLRVGINREGEIALSLLVSSPADGTAELAPGSQADLAPYLKDLYRGIRAQHRLLSLAEAGQGPSDRSLATATDLEMWATRRDAQAAFPQLVRRLVTASARDLSRISVRAGEGIGLPGWDGVVEAASWSAFVPEGMSVWEMGVGEPQAKAQSDYRKRTDAPGNVKPATTTFVFVSLRRWAGKDDWVQRRKAEGIWQDVRVIDADDIETWLETAPAVHAWLSALLGKDPWEAESLERWWTEWSEATRPAFPPAIPLSGRDADVSRLLTLLAEPGGSTSVVADSRDEALAFLAAALADVPQRLDRALIVRTPAAWRRLSKWSTPLILIPTFERPPVAVAVQAGHHVIMPLGREATNSGGRELARLRRVGIESALLGLGLPRDRASDLATLGRRSLFALRRTLAVNPDADRPDWAAPEHARSIALAVLAGSWNDASPGDREAVSAIAGRPYDAFVQDLSRWANASNPPVRRVGDVWLVAAKADTWTLTASALTSDDLDRFRAAAIAVVGGDDPALDLPPEQRVTASLVGKQRAHSGVLVRALADTLALMAASDPDVSLVGGRRGETEAIVVIRTVLEAANGDPTGRLWHAVSSVLPLLAEAAPDAFLRAVEAGARDADGPVLTLFQDDSGLLSSSSPHPSLLWALETLAWNPEYLPRAARALATLTRLAPPVKILNRPLNSLRSILVLWSNGTAASLDERVRVLDRIYRHEPDVGWALALTLIPSGSDTTSPPASATYRDWKPDDADDGIRADDLDLALDGVVQRACTYAGVDGARWAALLNRVASSVYPARDGVITALESVDPDALTPDGRRALYRTLRDITGKHQRYPGARWAMPKESTARLRALVPAFEPTDAANRHAWLFDQGAIDAFVKSDEEGYGERQKRLAEAQDAALAEILEEISIEDLVAWTDRLSNADFSSRHVGYSLARVRPDAPSALALLASTDETARRIGSNYVWLTAQSNGLEWAEAVLAGEASAWDMETVSRFLRSLPVSPDVWRIVDAQGPDVVRDYWRAMHPFALPSDGEEGLEAARRLVAAGRPREALDVFRNMGYSDPEAVPLDLLADTLEAAIETEDGPFDGTTAQGIGEHLDRLDAAGFDADRLARLEWAYLPLFRFEHRSSGVLHRALASEPEFFVRILSYVFRARGEEPVELTDGEQNRAQNAYALLDSWKTVPGQKDDGTIDPDELEDWLEDARRLLGEANRTEIGEQYIGRVMRWGPDAKPAPNDDVEPQASDPDAPPPLVDWPSEPIRNAIEAVSSDDLETGFELEVRNSRGVTSRGMTEGGAQERVLSRLYRQRASYVSASHPRTSAMLKRIAESYDRDAERNDRDAALTEDTWR